MDLLEQDLRNMKQKTVQIKEHEVARLASMLQASVGQVIAEKWNDDLHKQGMAPIYDAGDTRTNFVSVIKKWKTEMGR